MKAAYILINNLNLQFSTTIVFQFEENLPVSHVNDFILIFALYENYFPALGKKRGGLKINGQSLISVCQTLRIN